MGNKLLSKHQKSIKLISNLLREIRFNENLTNKNVQELTGLNKNTISRAENSRGIQLFTLLELCSVYGVKPSEVLSIIDWQ
ncbi:MAG: helix-turn-helix domain-containing protein [Anaerobacillus sp.]|uniref:helix-turn-helix domain-containing protein n=1 Tax=Anaerobacillus sp. TaxID=1872506 RepID=UPI00391B4DEF